MWVELKKTVQKNGSESEGSGFERFCIKDKGTVSDLLMFINLILQYRRRSRAVILEKGDCTKY